MEMKRAPAKFESLFENTFFPTTSKIPLFDLEMVGGICFWCKCEIKTKASNNHDYLKMIKVNGQDLFASLFI